MSQFAEMIFQTCPATSQRSKKAIMTQTMSIMWKMKEIVSEI